ncbi:MAG: hypothetical protein HY849_11440 [Nitrosomonadales bacterium]|nr:hypothetical protein [Nitrosomonadales bacterium]
MALFLYFSGGISIFIFPLCEGEFGLIFNSTLWSLLGSSFWGTVGIVYLYCTRGGFSRASRFTWGVLLIFSASVMNVEASQVIENIDFWMDKFPRHSASVLLALKLLLEMGKEMIAFGIAAIGAGVATFAIFEELPSKEKS